MAEAMLVIRSRCEEIGRDFHSLRISLLTRARDVPPAGEERVMIRPDSMEVDAL